MDDTAGERLVRVGIPAESGVAGGVIGVLPGQPAALPQQRSLGKRHHLRAHLVRDVRSTRRRGAAERDRLAAAADDALVLQVVGDLLFAGAEGLSRTALATARRFVVLDLRRAGTVDPAAAQILAASSPEPRPPGSGWC